MKTASCKFCCKKIYFLLNDIITVCKGRTGILLMTVDLQLLMAVNGIIRSPGQ